MNPAVKLVPSIFPRQVVRATVLGDVMKNYGLPDPVIEVAQAGLIAGDIVGITFTGIGPSGVVRERSTLSFDVLKQNDDMSMNITTGCSMVEALSRKLAFAISSSIQLMRQQNLSISYTFHIAEHCNSFAVCQKYGLSHNSDPLGGPPMRQLFHVSPGRDRGISFRHFSA